MRITRVLPVVAFSLLALYACSSDEATSGGGGGTVPEAGATPTDEGGADAGAGDTGTPPPVDAAPPPKDAGKDSGDSGLVVPDCSTHPCENGATCTDGADGGPYEFTCTCAPGYSGVLCATNVDDCTPNPCKNGGTCTDGVNAFTCTCPIGFDGPTCEGTTVTCASSPCKNGATCTDGPNGATCTCAAGWSGATCETNIDDCAPNPCQNGGTCTDGVSSFTCSCPAGYSGNKCQTNIDDCTPNPCQNGGTCTDGVNSHTCTCGTGYSGQNCEFSAFGNGSDGSLDVSGPVTINTVSTNVSGTTGQTSLTLASATGFAVGQVILIHQSQGTNAGKWQKATILGLTGTTATVTPSLVADFSSTGSNRAQAVVAPQYTSVTQSGSGVLTAPAWDGNKGGILVFNSTTAVTVNSALGISMFGKGFAGGISNNSDPASFQFKRQGDSYTGPGTTGNTSNVANGGGGNGGQKKVGCEGSGGGGAGYATVGISGGSHVSCLGFPGGVGGATYGDAALSTIFFGSGGGAGGYTTDPTLGAGGAGGGIIVIFGKDITLAPGAIDDRGADGKMEFGDYGGGGGGSGGSVYLAHAGTLTGAANVLVTGGSGGGTGGGRSEVGGAGGDGRVATVP